MIKKSIYLLFISIAVLSSAYAQDIDKLVSAVRNKLEKVKDYEASGNMKTNVAFLKLPVTKIKLYYKNPDKIKLKNEKGFAFIPKGSMNINAGSLFNNSRYTVIDAGTDKIGTMNVRVAKLLPEDDNSDVVLTTLYIDPLNLLIMKSKTTTRESGTYELGMKYGKYAEFGLPDMISFSFNTKDYKLPKGITFDFDDGKTNTKPKTQKPKKGEVQISFSKYEINKGLSEEVFR